MKHPLEFLPLNLRKPFFLYFFALTILIFGVFNILDEPFRNSVSPNGIVSLELAFTPYRTYEIILAWEYGGGPITLDDLQTNPLFGIGIVDGTRILPYHYLFFGLGLDYLFMVIYALSLSSGLLLAGDEKSAWYRSFTAWLGWGAFVAALFDAVENYALLQMLAGNIDSLFPLIAGVCATIKFILLIAGVLTALASKAVRK